MSRVEFWYDHHHTGALRIIDYGTQMIYGSDPKERQWECSFDVKPPHSIRVDFRSKKTHRGNKEMVATYTHHRNRLEWPDGNVWFRIRHDPRILLLRNHRIAGTERRLDRLTKIQ